MVSTLLLWRSIRAFSLRMGQSGSSALPKIESFFVFVPDGDKVIPLGGILADGGRERTQDFLR